MSMANDMASSLMYLDHPKSQAKPETGPGPGTRGVDAELPGVSQIELRTGDAFSASSLLSSGLAANSLAYQYRDHPSVQAKLGRGPGPGTFTAVVAG